MSTTGPSDSTMNQQPAEDNNQTAIKPSSSPCIPKKEFSLGITHDADNEEYNGTYSDSGEDSESEQVQTNQDEDQDDDEQGLVAEDGQTDSKNDKEKKKLKKDTKKPPTKAIAKRKPYQLVINVADTQYPVVRFVGKKLFKWKLCYDPEVLDCDLFWTDNAVQPETLGKMQPHQKINHFPGMFVLARKNYLAKNLKKMKKQFPDEFKFFPQTWLLPGEYNDLRNEFEKTSKGKCKTFIVKPEASCQGRGIFLTRNLDDLNSSDHYVVQRYLNKPFLLDGLKFDFRIYVLLAGCDPMRIYVFKEGLARLATEEYEPPHRDNLENLCMHLTNYAINKDNPNFEFNEDEHKMDVGHKRSMTSVLQLLADQGHDVPKLWEEIKDILVKTIVSAQPTLSHHYKSCQPDNYMNNMCFEILGFDVILDSNLRPWLLEINHTPSFTTDTPLDSLIKKNCIRDALVLMNLNSKSRNEIMSLRKEQLQKRVFTGKKQKLTQEEKLLEIKKGQQKRDEFESKNLGNYEKVYPLEPGVEDKYIPMQNYALQLYENWTGANIRRVSKKEQSGSLINGANTFNSAVKPSPCGSQPNPRNSIGEKPKGGAAAAVPLAKLPDRRVAAAKPAAPILMRASQSKSNIPGFLAAISRENNMEGEDGQFALPKQSQQQQKQMPKSRESAQSRGGIPSPNQTGGFSENNKQNIGEPESVVMNNLSALTQNKSPSPLNISNKTKKLQQLQTQLQGALKAQQQQQPLQQIEDDKQALMKKYAQYAVDFSSAQSNPKNKMESLVLDQPTSSTYSYIRQSSSSQNASASTSQQAYQSQNSSLAQLTPNQNAQQNSSNLSSGRQPLLTANYQQQQQQQQSQVYAQYIQSQVISQQQQQLLLLQQAKMLPGLVSRNNEDQLASLAFSKRLQEQANRLPKPLQISSNNGLYLQPKLFDLNMLTKTTEDDNIQQQRKDPTGVRNSSNNKQVIYSNVVFLGNNNFEANGTKSGIQNGRRK